MSKSFSLEFLRKQAKSILKLCREQNLPAIQRMRPHLPRLAALDDSHFAQQIQLADIHQALARENGYPSWGELKRHDAPLARFLTAIRGGALSTAQTELQNAPSIVEESIHAACAIGHADLVRHHLDASPALLTEQESGWTPLAYACGSRFHQLSQRHAAGTVECVTLLLDRGADPNACSALRRTLLVGNRSAALVLYQRGANQGVGAEARETAFKEAFWGIPENPTVVDKVLADLFADTEAVEQMNRRIRRIAEAGVRRGNLPPKPGPDQPLSPKDFYGPMYPSNQDFNVLIWELLIKRGVHPDWNDTSHDSPLHHLAMWDGDAATAEFFLQSGVDPNLRRADGKTPYFLAVRFGNAAVAKVLLAHGANSHVVSPADELIGACRRVDSETAFSIVRAHPEVLRTLSDQDYEVLVQSAARNRLDVVKLMLEIGFNPDAYGESGATALHAAAWHGHSDLVRLLLDSGGHVQQRDLMFGNSPIESAQHGLKHSRKSSEEYELIISLLRKAEG
jgi:ankyrin repeat protein